MIRLATLAGFIGAKFSGADVSCAGISVDTRTLLPQELYVALKGQKMDGHAFVKEAETKGAVGIIASEKIDTSLPTLIVPDTLLALGQLAKAYRDTFAIPMVAVTGSCGKTTVKDMLYSILSCAYPVLATQGNFNTEVGLPLTLLKLTAEHRAAVIEMGARKVQEIAYLMNLASPSVSILTNAGIAHVEIFGSEQDIAKAKGEIFECLAPTGTAVINQDDKHCGYWKNLLQGQKLITFGLENTGNQKPDITCLRLQQDSGVQFELLTDIGTIPIQMSVLGKHNVMNALAAAAGARAMGVSLENIQKGLAQFKAVPGRLENKIGFFGAHIIDDTYNANPTSVSAAMEVLVQSPREKILVLGDMKELGSKGPRLHYQVGVEAKQLGIEQIFCVGDLTTHTVEGYGLGAKHYANKQDLIDEIKRSIEARPSTVLIKGSRSMEMEEVVRALC
jgi:UDP-N-acetylmuramoyl-tripeptide--D-alanyl-D-alanine ligase